MQMRAVVKLACTGVCFDIGHQPSKVHRINMVQAKLLKPWGINKCRFFRRVLPVKRGAGGGVFA